MKRRLHLFAQQLQRLHHALVWDLGATIHFCQDPVETELFPQLHQPIGHLFGRADDDLIAPRLIVSNRLQSAPARRAIFDRTHAGAGG